MALLEVDEVGDEGSSSDSIRNGGRRGRVQQGRLDVNSRADGSDRRGAEGSGLAQEKGSTYSQEENRPRRRRRRRHRRRDSWMGSWRSRSQRSSADRRPQLERIAAGVGGSADPRQGQDSLLGRQASASSRCRQSREESASPRRQQSPRTSRRRGRSAGAEVRAALELPERLIPQRDVKRAQEVVVHLISHADRRRESSGEWPWEKSFGVRNIKSKESMRHARHPGIHPVIRSCTRKSEEYLLHKREILKYRTGRIQETPGLRRIDLGISCRSGVHRSVSFAIELALDLEGAFRQVGVSHYEMDSWPPTCRAGKCRECGLNAWWVGRDGLISLPADHVRHGCLTLARRP